MGNLTPHLMLSEEQIEAFFEIGFVIVPDVFTPTEIEEMRAGFDRLQKMAYALSEAGIHNGSDFAIERKESGQVIIHRISWCGAAEPVLLAETAAYFHKRLCLPGRQLANLSRQRRRQALKDRQLTTNTSGSRLTPCRDDTRDGTGAVPYNTLPR